MAIDQSKALDRLHHHCKTLWSHWYISPTVLKKTQYAAVVGGSPHNALAPISDILEKPYQPMSAITENWDKKLYTLLAIDLIQIAIGIIKKTPI